jgi:hypothetical protein
MCKSGLCFQVKTLKHLETFEVVPSLQAVSAHALSEIKSSFPVALICTTSRRIPASASVNQTLEKAIWSCFEDI